MDLTSDVTANEDLRLSISPLSHELPICFMLSFDLNTSQQSLSGMLLFTTASSLRLCFCQFLVVYSQNKITNFLAKAGATLPYVFHCGPLLILPRRSHTQTRCSSFGDAMFHTHI